MSTMSATDQPTPDTDPDLSTEDAGDNNLTVGFSTLFFSLGSILLTAIVLIFTVFQFVSTADFIIRTAAGGGSKVQQIANTIVNQAKAVLSSTVPEIEQTAENVVTAIVGGITTTVNSITSVGGAILGLITDSFLELTNLLRDYGLQITQLALNSILPIIRSIGVGLGFILDIFDVTSALWQSWASIVETIINTFGGLHT